ncbi:MAG: RnfABCDGE type electron transport complex subunit B [Proteobacteria bacterium]|nr:RnfABCDGE type electron transport complex subunit B [Pseudomonadota bacterium]
MIKLSVSAINTCLPQTQCQRCSYPCCKDYAVAISRGEANINQCPPGGAVTIEKLSTLSGQPALPLDPEFGEFQAKALAFIIEEKCIGCVLCIKVCPVDAIVGANKLMHSIFQDYCTGCELCLPVCPTDCIKMRPLETEVEPQSDWPGYSPDDISLGKTRFERRQLRLSSQAGEKPEPAKLDQNARQQAILEAVKRKMRKT